MTRLLMALLVLPILTLVPEALRAESEIYGGAGIGYSTFGVDVTGFEDSGLATRQFVGVRYGRFVGVEAGYIDFGTANDQVADPFGFGTVNQGIETWGYDLSLVGRYPLNDELAAFGKLGIIRWDSEDTLEPVPLPNKTDGDDLIWGVGLDFRGSARVHIRVEAELVDIAFANSWWVLTTSVMYGIPFAR
jgi:OmpA-OmpF porin, OOP family